MKRKFLEKYFPASRASAIRKEICGIRQQANEILYDYWERFKKLCASCPHHQISEQLLIQYFYEGLLPMERCLIDVASGGALVDKTPMAARALISNMAENSQQFSTRISPPTRSCHAIQSYQEEQQQMENRIDELTSLVRQMAMQQHQQFQHQNQQQPYTNFYNPCWNEQPNFENGHAPIQQLEHAFPSFNSSWRDNPLFSSNNQVDPTMFQPPTTHQPLAIEVVNAIMCQPEPNMESFQVFEPNQQQTYQEEQAPPSSPFQPTLEELVKQMATNNLLFQQKIEATFQDLQNQIGQLASSMSELTTQVFDNLPSPSPTDSNLRETCVVIKLRSGKALIVPKNPSQASKQVQESQQANSENFARDVQEQEEQNFEENFSKQNVGESQGKQQEKGDVLDPFMHAAFEFNDAFASDFGVHDSDFSAVSGFAAVSAVSAVSAFPNSEFSDFATNFDNYETKHVFDDHHLHSFEFVIQEDDSKLSRSKSDLRIAIGGMLMDEEEDYHDTTLLDHERFQPFQAKDEKSFYIDPG